ncbi:hypothetical protein FRC01_000550 [Tulasnella sp. 417]|nr:hypothetical protein FRC01_000550 [Tulasnella sp. 417]
MAHPGRTGMRPLATNAAAGCPQTSSPSISNLPVEVFQKIIIITALKGEVGGSYYNRLRALRLVATSWSASIDDCPQCWSIISSSEPEAVCSMALQKSKQAEIDVDSAATSRHSIRNRDDTRTLTKAIFIHMPRVRKLAILDRDFEYIIEHALTAPRLRTLDLRGSIGLVGHGPITLVNPFHSAQWAPNLQDLFLNWSNFIRKGVLWSNLEYLHIDAGVYEQMFPREEVFTILAASPGLRILSLTDLGLPRSSGHWRRIPTVKLEALECLILDVRGGSPPFEALNSIIASPTTTCRIHFTASDENLRPENLRSIGRFASRITGGETGSVLKLVQSRYSSGVTMDGFDVAISGYGHNQLGSLVVSAAILEGIPPQRRLEVETVEVSDMYPPRVLGLLPIISSKFPNTRHLSMSTLNGDLANSVGGISNKRLFPHLESLSIASYRGRRHALNAIKPRLKGLDLGEQLAKLKRLTLTFFRVSNMDEVEIAELGALVPEVIVNRLVSHRA